MLYTRAAASDYDDWEKLGNPGWGSKDLIPLAKKVCDTYSSSRIFFIPLQIETYQVSSGDPSVHGFTGPIKISHGGRNTNIGKEFLEVASQYDHDRGMSTDTNDFRTVNVYGVSFLLVVVSETQVFTCSLGTCKQVLPFISLSLILPRYIDADTGKRSDTAHHFIYSLDTEANNGKHNLHVIVNRRVVKVLFEYAFFLSLQFCQR